MRKIVDYYTVASPESLLELDELVMDGIADGDEPLGGVSMIGDEYGNYYAQAMVRYEDSDAEKEQHDDSETA